MWLALALTSAHSTKRSGPARRAATQKTRSTVANSTAPSLWSLTVWSLPRQSNQTTSLDLALGIRRPGELQKSQSLRRSSVRVLSAKKMPHLLVRVSALPLASSLATQSNQCRRVWRPHRSACAWLRISWPRCRAALARVHHWATSRRSFASARPMPRWPLKN